MAIFSNTVQVIWVERKCYHQDIKKGTLLGEKNDINRSNMESATRFPSELDSSFFSLWVKVFLMFQNNIYFHQSSCQFQISLWSAHFMAAFYPQENYQSDVCTCHKIIFFIRLSLILSFVTNSKKNKTPKITEDFLFNYSCFSFISIFIFPYRFYTNSYLIVYYFTTFSNQKTFL